MKVSNLIGPLPVFRRLSETGIFKVVNMAYNDVYGLALVVALLGLVYWIYHFVVAPFRVLAHHGIRGPPPLAFFGNWKAMVRLGQLKFMDETIKDYGAVCGYVY